LKARVAESGTLKIRLEEVNLCRAHAANRSTFEVSAWGLNLFECRKVAIHTFEVRSN
jgi:hypothetical protein